MKVLPVRIPLSAMPVACQMLLILAGCDGTGGKAEDQPATEVVAALSIEDGDGQTEVVGAELSLALIVRVVDANGRPLAGQIVNFRVTEGGGSAFAGVAASDAEGRANERWTLGTRAGRQQLEARAVDARGRALVFATFTATALAGDPATLRVTAGDGQSGPPGQALSSPITVTLADRFGNPVPGRQVHFEPDHGSASPSTVVSGVAGEATTTWTLGAMLGAQVLEVSSEEVATTARATAIGQDADGGSGTPSDTGMPFDTGTPPDAGGQDAGSNHDAGSMPRMDASADDAGLSQDSGAVARCDADIHCTSSEFCEETHCFARCSASGAYCGLAMAEPSALAAERETIFWALADGVWAWSGTQPIKVAMPGPASALVVAETDLYFVVAGALSRVPVTGGSAPQALASNVTRVWKTATHVMWSRTNAAQVELWSLARTGGAMAQLVGSIAVGEWVASNAAYAVAFVAAGPPHFLVKTLPSLTDVRRLDVDSFLLASSEAVADDAYLYFADDNGIKRLSFANTNDVQTLVTGIMPGSHWNFVASERWLYWMAYGGPFEVGRSHANAAAPTEVLPLPELTRTLYAVTRNRVVTYHETEKRLVVRAMPAVPCGPSMACPFDMVCGTDSHCADPQGSSASFACAVQSGSDSGSCAPP